LDVAIEKSTQPATRQNVYRNHNQQAAAQQRASYDSNVGSVNSSVGIQSCMDSLKDDIDLEIENIDEIVRNPSKNHFVRFSLPVLEIQHIEQKVKE
jgi:hypothetical protein